MNSQENSPLLRKSGPDQVDKTSGSKPKMQFAQIKTFLKIAYPFFKEDSSARCSLLGLVILTLLDSAITIVFSYVKRDLYDALNDKDEQSFYKDMGYFFIVLIIAVPLSVFYRYLREKLALHWREALTARVLDKYYANRTYYIIETLRDIDNPDQRIAEDVNEFTSTSLSFFFILFDAVVNLISFSVVLFQIFPTLFYAIIIYAVLGSYVTMKIGRSLVGLYYDKYQREADFRFGLIRTRENAEGIAFYDSKATLEQINIWKLFQKVLQNQLSIIRLQRNIEVFTDSYDYLAYIVPMAVVAPLYFAGKIDMGAITQSSEAFYNVRSDFSIVVNYYEDLSQFSAGMNRLHMFIDRITEGGWHLDTPTHNSDCSNAPLASTSVSDVEDEDANLDSHDTGEDDDDYLGAVDHDYKKAASMRTSSPLSSSWCLWCSSWWSWISCCCIARKSLPKRLTKVISKEDFDKRMGLVTASDDRFPKITIACCRPAGGDNLGTGSSSSSGEKMRNRNGSECSTIVPFASYSATPAASPGSGSIEAVYKTPGGSSVVVSSLDAPPILECLNLTILTPDGSRALVGGISLNSAINYSGMNSIAAHSNTRTYRGINFSLHAGERMLIVGPSGCGKSSLLRVIAGLWEIGSGEILWGLDAAPMTAIGRSEQGRGEEDDAPDRLAFSLSSSSPSLPYSPSPSFSSSSPSPLLQATAPTASSLLHFNSMMADKVPPGVFFLPQKPYNLLGTLRQQIMYPSVGGRYSTPPAASGDDDTDADEKIRTTRACGTESNAYHGDEDESVGGRGDLSAGIDVDTSFMCHDIDDELLNVLKRVRLDKLAARMGGGEARKGLDAYKDWSKVLSLGEQQRLAFARVVYNKPSVVVLDESTSALDAETEAIMYNLLAKLKVTYISVGHNATLIKYHDKKLTLSGPGSEVEVVSLHSSTVSASSVGGNSSRSRSGSREEDHKEQKTSK